MVHITPSDDPLKDFDSWEAELAKLPVCDWCGEPIHEEFAYRINGDLVCKRCLEEMKEYF